jgi:hypothetical protein
MLNARIKRFLIMCKTSCDCWRAGLRMLDQPYMTDLIEANSMGHMPQKIHIYSASWGPTDDGKTVDGPRNATMRAIVKGVNEVIRAVKKRHAHRARNC